MSWSLLLSRLRVVDGGVSDALRQWREGYLHVEGNFLLQLFETDNDHLDNQVGTSNEPTFSPTRKRKPRLRKGVCIESIGRCRWS